MVRARLPAKPLFSVSGREPRTGNSEIGGPGAGTVRARLPAMPLISVSGREPRAGNSEIGGPGSGTVRARLPASPLISVSGREPRAGNFEIGGPRLAKVCVRLPSKPLISVSVRKPRTARSGNGGPEPAKVCVRLPAKPYAFVPGSKFFTQLPAGKCDFASGLVGRFAPRSPLSLMPSFRGANSSHNYRPESTVSPAIGPAGLLPAPRYALFLRSGEQILHTTTGRKTRFRRRHFLCLFLVLD